MAYHELSQRKLKRIKDEIKMLLHAHRDAMRNRGDDTTSITFDVGDGYYGEAFGTLRTLAILGYGYFGSSNLDAIQEHQSHQSYHNLRWWMGQIEDEVLKEEGYGGDNHCEYCYVKYGKDAVRVNNKRWG